MSPPYQIQRAAASYHPPDIVVHDRAPDETVPYGFTALSLPDYNRVDLAIGRGLLHHEDLLDRLEALPELDPIGPVLPFSAVVPQDQTTDQPVGFVELRYVGGAPWQEAMFRDGLHVPDRVDLRPADILDIVYTARVAGYPGHNTIEYAWHAPDDGADRRREQLSPYYDLLAASPGGLPSAGDLSVTTTAKR